MLVLHILEIRSTKVANGAPMPFSHELIDVSRKAVMLSRRWRYDVDGRLRIHRGLLTVAKEQSTDAAGDGPYRMSSCTA